MEGLDPALRLTGGSVTIFTPVRLAVEVVLADEIATPPGVRYVQAGGTLPDGSTEIISGYGPELEVGGRYVIFASPLTLDAGTLDPKYMFVRYSMPIRADGTVAPDVEQGRKETLTLGEVVAQVARAAPRERWRPNPGERLKRYGE